MAVPIALTPAVRRRCAAALVALTVVFVHPATAVEQNPTGSVPDYSSRAREVVTDLAAGRFDRVFAQFNDSHSPTLSPTSIANGWNAVMTQSGQFRRIESVQVADRNYHVATIACVFDKTSRIITIYFDDAGRVAGLRYAPATTSAADAAALWNPPSYVESAAFHEESVVIDDGRWRLPGMLTTPNGKGPFPGAVLVSGSGPNDADETFGPNKPFKDLAWGLASRGIAVLRYPKRTRVYGTASSADPRAFTVKDEYVDDARAAVALLTSQPRIDPKRVFLVGHSEGGYLAPRIATGDPEIAGIIVLEGNTRSIQQAVVDQARYLAGLGREDAARMLPELERQAAAMDAAGLKPGTSLRLLSGTIPSSYVLDLREYDPTAVAARLRVPIYVAQGGRDYQVTGVDFAKWQHALAGRPRTTLKLYPSLDHLLVSGHGPSTPEQYAEPGRHVSADIVLDLVAWISAQ